jgi:hypothetical protein
MFFYCRFYLTSFFPSIFPATKIASKFLPQRNEVKNARQMQSHWLVALLSHDNWVFSRVVSIWYFWLVFGWYFLVITVPITEENLAGTFPYYCFGGNPHFP